MELAVAGQADYLVTRNVKDLRGGRASTLALSLPRLSDPQGMRADLVRYAYLIILVVTRARTELASKHT
jgi:hypothetical protein